MKDNFEYYSLLYAITGDVIGLYSKLNRNDNPMICTNNNDALLLSGWANYNNYKFISEGGYSGFKLNTHNSSESAIFMLSIYDSLINNKNKYNKDLLIKMMIIKMSEYYDQDKNKTNRFYDEITINRLENIIKKDNYSDHSYNDISNGSEPLVRGISIGLIFYGEKNRNKLLELSIEISKATHNNATSFIGTFATALFIALAIEKVDPNNWIDILVDFFIEGKILNHIKSITPKKLSHEIKYYTKDIVEYQYLLNKYKQVRFNKKNKFLSSNNGGSKYLMFLNDRAFYFYKKFGSPGIFNPGSNGLDCILIAYDSFMESGSSFEKLIYNAMLFPGQSNVIGCISGALFGAYYGNKNLENNLSNIDLKDKLNNLVT